MTKPKHDNHSNARKIPIKIDGEVIRVTHAEQTARGLLERAAVNPDEYDLCRILKGGAEPERFADDQVITVAPGDNFVTKRERGTVA